MPSASYAEYTGSDFLRDASYTLIVADWAQTLQIADTPPCDNCNRDYYYYESNIDWIIGKHPSRTNVNAYFISKLLLTYFINKTRYADYWNFYVTVDLTTVVYHNYRAGLSINF